MEQTQADKILQNQDVTKNAAAVLRQMEADAQAKKITHSECVAASVRSGAVLSIETGIVSIRIEPTIHASADKLHAILTHTHKASGVTSTASVVLETRGGCAFVGSVPGTQAGKSQLIFVRSTIHFWK